MVIAHNGHRCSGVDGFTIRNGVGSEIGGGIWCDRGAPIIANNIITGNTATDGAGIMCSSASPIIRCNTISWNSATGRGGGIWCYSFCAPEITNNVISGNRSANGGGIYCSYYAAPTIANNTLAANSAPIGAGIACSMYCSPSILNNIVAFNTSGLYDDGKGTPILHNNNVHANTDYDYSGLVPGPDDIPVDPKFGDQASGNYHLKSDSPCRDAGYDVAVQAGLLDIDGQTRIHGVHVDIGADEWWPGAADAKGTGEGVGIALSAETVTAAFLDFFYIEAQDRSSGIRIEKSGHGIGAGMRVDVNGSAHVNPDGEACVVADSVALNGCGSLAPLGLSPSLVGGGACGNQAATWGLRYAPDLTGRPVRSWGEAFGLNNIGLLIKTCGKFTKTGDSTFTLDDGSGDTINCIAPDGVTLDPAWSYVTVTGISSCEKVGGEIHRLIRAVSVSPVQ